MIHAIIFDLDDTLIDFVERKKRIISDVVKAMIKSGIKQNFSSLYKEFYDFYWSTGIEDHLIFEKFLKTKYGKIDYSLLAKLIIVYRHADSKLLKPYPDVLATLKYLKSKHIKIAILTDAPRLDAYLRVYETGMDKHIDLIVTKDDTHALKPSPKGFKMIIESFKITPAECLMVGDSGRDIIGAKNLGIKTCKANYANKSNIKADYEISNIRELKKII